MQVANRRLFSIVREERQLTYDASFTLQQREIVEGVCCICFFHQLRKWCGKVSCHLCSSNFFVHYLPHKHFSHNPFKQVRGIPCR